MVVRVLYTVSWLMMAFVTKPGIDSTIKQCLELNDCISIDCYIQGVRCNTLNDDVDVSGVTNKSSLPL